MTAERPLGWVHVASVVIGAIVGVGIFFTPANLAKILPSPGWVLGLWALGGVVSVAGALVFAELGGRYPHAGGVYVFLREGFGRRAGPFVAFQYGWLQLLVVQPGSMAVIALVLMGNVAFLTGPLPEAVTLGGAVLVLAVFTGANLLGMKTGGRIQVAMAAMKVGALAIIIVTGLLWGSASNLTAPRSEHPGGGAPTWLVLGLIPVLWSFGGAYHGTFIAGSVREPQRSVPRGIVAGIFVVLVGYTGVNLAYLAVLGHDGLAATTSPAAAATSVAIGEAAGKALAAVIVLSAAGILNTVCLGFPFVIYAMAKDKLFFARAGRLDPRTGRPAIAVAAQGALACVAVLVASRIDTLLTGIAFADASFQAAVAVVFLLQKRDQRQSPKRAAGLLRAPTAAGWIFLALELGLAIGCLVNNPRESAYGAAVLIVGAGIWNLWRRGA